MSTPTARVHVDHYDPIDYAGDDALVRAQSMAEMCRVDFPEGVIGVSYNPAARESAYRLRMEAMGLDPDCLKGDSDA